MKKIPLRARLRRCFDAAVEFIQDQEIHWFPVDPFEIAKRNGWKVKTVTEVSLSSGIPINRILKGKDGNVYYKNHEYSIVYDERVPSKERIRWTIMHEIGHIVLGHLRDFEQTTLWRGGVTDKEHKVLERETNIFSAEVFAPFAVMKATKILHSIDITRYFKLSKDAADIRQVDLKTYGFHLSYLLHSDSHLRESFKHFIRPIAYCSNYDPYYLNIPDRLVQYRIEEEKIMFGEKQIGIKIEENGRFTFCPNCENYHFSDKASFCKMCGHYLFNDCQRKEPDYQEYCGKVNAGDARYCEDCGAETFLLSKGLLFTWEEMIAEFGSVNITEEDVKSFKLIEKDWNKTNNTDPFTDNGPLIEISDSDLPFK